MYRERLGELDARLTATCEAIRRREQLQRVRDRASQDRHALRGRIEELAATLARESADVKRLEEMTLTAMFCAVLGSKEAKLDRERKEEMAARLRHDEATAELAAVEAQIDQLERKLERLSGADEAYGEAFKEKARFLQKEGGAAAEELLQLAEEAGRLRADVDEVEEAFTAGRAALHALQGVKEALDSAGNWGAWDMLGGGFVSSAMKHSSIDAARERLARAQKALRVFQCELAELDLDVEAEVEIEPISAFADHLFDDFFSDWAVQAKIQKAAASTEESIAEVESLVRSLEAKRGELKKKLRRIKDRRRRRIIEAR